MIIHHGAGGYVNISMVTTIPGWVSPIIPALFIILQAP